ncbi:hypothetical protein O4H26_13170 [Aequorivita viscosa]|nr:hypothetical protein [Aequorivita viscosa]
MKLEVVLESFEDLLLASKQNIDRIELVSALDLGGLSPSLALVNQFYIIPELNLQIMIRPRPGGFTYSNFEIHVMNEEIKMMADQGVRGVVFGCLDDKLNIDEKTTEKLFSTASSLGLETTFNRAFDFCKDQDRAIIFLTDLGFNRILSAGSTSSIDTGYKKLEQLLQKTENKIGVIAAGGINEKNIIPLLGMELESIHFSIRKPKKNEVNDYAGLGNEYNSDIDKLNTICQLTQ